MPKELKRNYGISFRMRMGLNSGPVVVASIGDDLRMDYTAQGDTANLASRMESSAEPGAILASEYTYRLARDFFQFASKGTVRVKGRSAPLEVHRLLGAGEIETRMAASAAKGPNPFRGPQAGAGSPRGGVSKDRIGPGPGGGDRG